MRKTFENRYFLTDLTCEWDQLWNKYNWYTYNFIHFHIENDTYCGEREFAIIILGFGLRIAWSAPTPQSEANRAKWSKMMNKWMAKK